MFLSSRHGNNIDLRSLTLFCLFAFFLSSSVLSVSTNVTIDDEDGDARTGAKPTYLPSGAWSQGAECSGCLAQPDPLHTFDGTWHDSTIAPGDGPYTIEVSFIGTSVYAFFVLANNIQFATTFTNLSFSLDGSDAGSFVHNPTSGTDYQYNVSGFASTGLENTKHNLIISNVGATSDSLALFDYLVYTVEDDFEQTTTSSSNVTNMSSISPQNSISPSSSSSSTSSKASTSTFQSTVFPSSSSTTQNTIFSTSTTQIILATDTTKSLPSDATSISPTDTTSTTSTISQTISNLEAPQSPPVAPSDTPFTTSNPSANQSVSHNTTNHTGAILGGLIGGATAIALVAVLLFCWRRRRRVHNNSLVRISPLNIPANEPASAVEQRASTRASTDFLSLGTAGSEDFLYLDSRHPETLPSLIPTFWPSASRAALSSRPVSEFNADFLRNFVRQQEPNSTTFNMEKVDSVVDSPDAGYAQAEVESGHENMHMPLSRSRGDDLSWADDGASGNDQPPPEYYAKDTSVVNSLRRHS